MAIKAENVLKILDVHKDQLTIGLISLLREHFCIYTDQIENEDIYNPLDVDAESIVESSHQYAKCPEVKQEFKELVNLINKKNCSYVRLLTM